MGREKEAYICIGRERGWCGVVHRNKKTAKRCIKRDTEFCQMSFHKDSDRKIFHVNDERVSRKRIRIYYLKDSEPMFGEEEEEEPKPKKKRKKRKKKEPEPEEEELEMYIPDEEEVEDLGDDLKDYKDRPIPKVPKDRPVIPVQSIDVDIEEENLSEMVDNIKVLKHIFNSFAVQTSDIGASLSMEEDRIETIIEELQEKELVEQINDNGLTFWSCRKTHESHKWEEVLEDLIKNDD